MCSGVMSEIPTYLYLFSWLPFLLAFAFYYYGLHDWAYKIGKYLVVFGAGVMVGITVV